MSALLRLPGGRHLDLLADDWPQEQLPSVREIAHSLAQICRYSGWPQRFYSVAQHSVQISRRVPDSLALTALLHDSSEALLSDIPSPVKIAVPGLLSLEERLLAALARRHGFVHPLPDEVLVQDLALREEEESLLFGTAAQDEVAIWTPAAAKAAFLDRYRVITGKEP